MTLGECLLTPTKIYVDLVMDLIKKFEIKSISHITGGGLIENIPRVIPNNLGVRINKNSWVKPNIFKLIENLDIDEFELYKSFNMGIGLCIVVSSDISNEVLESIKSFGEESYIIGEVIEGSGVSLW